MSFESWKGRGHAYQRPETFREVVVVGQLVQGTWTVLINQKRHAVEVRGISGCPHCWSRILGSFSQRVVVFAFA
jgi:hypothetical protein